MFYRSSGRIFDGGKDGDMKQKSRISLTMFDLLKGVVILLVIHRHTFVYVEEYTSAAARLPGRMLLTLLMPCLFMVSGYWLGRRKIKTGIKSSIHSLLKPYLIVNIVIVGIAFVHRALFHRMKDWVDHFLIGAVLGRFDLGRIGAVWFLAALFVANFIYYIVINLLKEKGQAAAACLCAAAGALLLPLRLPFLISQGLIAFFYVYAGYFFKKKKLLEKEIPPGVYLAITVLWVAGSVSGRMDLALYKMENGLLVIPGCLCGGFLLIRIFLRLNVLEWKILDPIRWMGRYSLWILCIHTVEDEIFLPWKILFRFFPRETVLGAWFHFILRCVLIVVSCRIMLLLRQRSSGKRRGV